MEVAGQGGIGEMVRVRWNREVRGAVKWVEEKDWNQLGRDVVDFVGVRVGRLVEDKGGKS